jgi:hypothetical protein|nr:MAG TPA: hypothetical protein [Caudoviricetes sp.]
MIINIDDTTNLKRIILEFDESSNNSDEEINIINSNSNTTNKTIKPKSRKTTKQDDKSETLTDNTDVPIDFKDYLESTEISQSLSSQEIIQKPVIPDIDRDVKIADNMQNLKI